VDTASSSDDEGGALHLHGVTAAGAVGLDSGSTTGSDAASSASSGRDDATPTAPVAAVGTVVARVGKSGAFT